MDELKQIHELLLEDIFKDNNCVINKSLIQQYKISTEIASNVSSLHVYDDVWLNNKETFNEKSSEIFKSLKKITKDVDTTKTSSWESSLSKLDDPIDLFEESLANCTSNCLGLTTAVGLERFESQKCTCNLHIKEPNKENIQDKKQHYIKKFNSNSSIDELNLGDEQQMIKPKFVRPRPLLKTINSTNQATSSTSNYTSYPDIDLIRETDKYAYKKGVLSQEDLENDVGKSNSNVAKITFKTAKEQLLASNPAAKRTLGTSRKAQGKFVSPMIGAQDKQEIVEPEVTDERLKHIDPKMVELIESEIIDKGNPIGWEDIAGLQMAKSVIQEAVVWPLLRPDIFTGLRRPPKGILLFGPPGTGKTLIGKCVAAQCRATFFSISASSLTSKWIGDGEKMVRALFAVARTRQPAVIFIDEIDSLLTQRNDTEHEATRRIKTEFLVQFDGAATGDEDRILIVGATNRPQELDEAARRRLVKRLYIPLPDVHARTQIIMNLLANENNSLNPAQVSEVATLTDGYSGADMKSLCSEAAMGPIRAVPLSQIVTIQRDKVRPVNLQDFKNALQRVRPSVSQDDLGQYVKWNKTYGQGF